jgi:hypothetical protein
MACVTGLCSKWQQGDSMCAYASLSLGTPSEVLATLPNQNYMCESMRRVPMADQICSVVYTFLQLLLQCYPAARRAVWLISCPPRLCASQPVACLVTALADESRCCCFWQCARS